ncbi:MAG: hypothetical protein JWP89_390 [Schlesneria sp.]|nr:hypothetical protein [Schlesneria sp.]
MIGSLQSIPTGDTLARLPIGHASRGTSLMAAPATLSIPDMERLLVEKTKRLESLIEQRDKLQKQIKALDRQIQDAAHLDGAPRPRRRRSKTPLRKFVLEALEQNKEGLSIAELTRQVLAAGYQSRSRRPENVVHQCLYNTPAIERNAKTKRYSLKK